MMPSLDNDANADDADLLLAVRYLLDECSCEESADFEARLADDSIAQEALVQATRIVAMLQATPACPLSRPQPLDLPASRSWRAAALIAAGLFAVLTIGWQLLRTPQPTNTVAAIEPTALTEVWADLGSDGWITTSELPFDESDPTNNDEVAIAEVEDIENEPSDEASDDVPDWMLTAVLVEIEQANPGDAIIE